MALLAILPASAADATSTGGPSPVVNFGLALVVLGLGFGLGWYAQRSSPQRPAAPTKATGVDAAITGLPYPALLYNNAGEWIAANAAARQFFTDRHMTAAEAAPSDLAERIRACVANPQADSALEAAVGTLCIGWSLEPLPDGGVRATLTDLTAQKGRETVLIRERDAALAAAQATSDFVATLSHDIRVPMNGVLGMANLLLEAGLTPQQKDLARSVVVSAESVITLADELLDLAKIQAGKLEINPQPTEVGPLVDELLRSQAARAAEKRLDLAGDVDAALPAVVNLDPTRLRQILSNLLSNALKFTDRGEVFVRAWTETTEAGEELRFSVRDTGIGIPPEQRDRLFQAFSQADASTYGIYGGTGLGLVICQRVAGLMGGRVWFESEPNRGSTFYLALPFVPAEGATPPTWTLPQSSLQGRNILIVDDNPRLSALVAGWVSRWGATAAVFRNAAETSGWLDAGGRCTAALVDLDMPDNGGLAVLRRLAQIQLAPRMIALASRPPEKNSSLGNAEVLLKPVNPEGILECLRRTAPRASVPAVAPAKPPATGPRARVIVADDDVVNQKVMRNFLERLGCEVRLAANGVEALALVGSGPCDVLFLDIMMPRLDGLQTVRELRRLEAERTPPGGRPLRLPVVAITAKVMPGDRENGFAAGFDDYATKPVGDARLRDALQKFVPNFQLPAAAAAGVTMLATPQIALVDRERINELSSGDRETAHEIVTLFFERMDALLPDIEATLSANDLIEARRHAHTGAGSCATCGIMQGQNVMRRLERSIEAGQVEHSRELIAESRRVLAAARDSLADLLRKV